MFGMGGTEILVILVVALLFLGPEKLPEAAKTISKGIRDLRKQTRDLQNTIEMDTEIGGAIRDIKSALRGEELPRPRSPKPTPLNEGADAAAAIAASPAPALAEATPQGAVAAEASPAPPLPTLPGRAGERDEVGEGAAAPAEDNALRSLIRPAVGTVAKGDTAPSERRRADS